MIPKKIHFIYGLKPDFGGIPFNFCHWVAVKSAAKLNPDYEIHFWYEFEPDTYYFKDLKDLMVLHKIEAPKEIFGNPIPHFAHRADVLRLQILLEHGGVYLDMDTITVKPYDFFLDKKVVMSVVKNSGNIYGLCNAVMMGEPNAVFFSEWLKAFTGFRSEGYDQFYDEFACNYPLILANRIPEEITVFSENLFFYPDMTQIGLTQLFVETGEYPEAYCHHLWEKNAINILKRYNERNYLHLPSTYTNYIKNIIGAECNDLNEKRMQWRDDQLSSGLAKLNIGSGTRNYLDYVNCDMFEGTGADIVFNATRSQWPIPDNSVTHVELSHVIEHFDGDVSHFFKELYRVSKNGCTVDIRVPHPRHEWFIQDPTHAHPWIARSFLHFDRNICLSWFLNGNTETPLALYWNIDFEIVSTEHTIQQNPVLDLLNNSLKVDANTASHFLNNVISEVHVLLKARKF